MRAAMDGLRLWTNHVVPPNDGGISLGQAALAALATGVRDADMHELSIALALVEMAAEEAERHGARVVAVHLRLGPLSGVVKEALLSPMSWRAGTPLEGTRW